MNTATTVDARTTTTDATPKALSAIDMLDRSNMPRCIELVVDAPSIQGAILVLRDWVGISQGEHRAICEWLVAQDWEWVAITLRVCCANQTRLTVMALPRETLSRQMEAL